MADKNSASNQITQKVGVVKKNINTGQIAQLFFLVVIFPIFYSGFNFFSKGKKGGYKMLQYVSNEHKILCGVKRKPEQK